MFDIILVDLSPSSGPFNRSIILGSDYFIIPYSADFFSLQAMQFLKKSIPEWYDYCIGHLEEACSAHNSMFTTRIFKINTIPNFLLSFPQRIRTISRASKKHQRRYREWITRIDSESKVMAQKFKNNKIYGRPVSMVGDNFTYQTPIGVTDFVGLGLETQSSGRPMADYLRLQGKEEKIRTERAYNEYSQIINIMFSNFKTERLSQLPDGVRLELSLERDIRITNDPIEYSDLDPRTPYFDEEGEGGRKFNNALYS